MGTKTKKKVKMIKIDPSKCNGCRGCELICSAFHATPRFSNYNPARARIRVFFKPMDDIYLPVLAGQYTGAECSGKDQYVIDGKEYGECAFCRASCPSRNLFKEPDSGLPLKCDLCLSDPTLQEPMCVQWCRTGALTYVEREAQAGEEEPGREEPDAELELDVALAALVDRYGLEKLAGGIARIAAQE